MPPYVKTADGLNGYERWEDAADSGRIGWFKRWSNGRLTVPPYVTRQPLSAGGGPPDRPSEKPAQDLTVDALVHVEPAPTADEWRQRLLDGLLDLATHSFPADRVERHRRAGTLLLAYIDDPEIRAAYERAVA